MSERPRPWWASEDDVADLEDVDPVEAFRQARRTDRSSRGSDDPATSAEDPPATGHDPAFCGICPLCTLARTLEDTRPELLEHLTEAARHLASAVRSLLEAAPDGAAERSRGAAPAEPDPDGLQHIDLDQEPTEGGRT